MQGRGDWYPRSGYDEGAQTNLVRQYRRPLWRYFESQSYDPHAEIENAFVEVLDEGAANIRGGLTSTNNTVIGTPLKLIPWQVWAFASLYVASRLGAFDGIARG